MARSINFVVVSPRAQAVHFASRRRAARSGFRTVRIRKFQSRQRSGFEFLAIAEDVTTQELKAKLQHCPTGRQMPLGCPKVGVDRTVGVQREGTLTLLENSHGIPFPSLKKSQTKKFASRNFCVKNPSRSDGPQKHPTPLTNDAAALVTMMTGGEPDGGRPRRGTGGVNVRNKRPARRIISLSLVAGLLLALLLTGIGAAIYYAHCIREQTDRLERLCENFSAESSGHPPGAPGADGRRSRMGSWPRCDLRHWGRGFGRTAVHLGMAPPHRCPAIA